MSWNCKEIKAAMGHSSPCTCSHFIFLLRFSSGWTIVQFGLEDFVVRVRQQTANIGCLVYQMIRPTYTGCCERKKNMKPSIVSRLYIPKISFF